MMHKERDFETGGVVNVCGLHGFRGVGLPCPYPSCSEEWWRALPAPWEGPQATEEEAKAFTFGEPVTFVREKVTLGDRENGGTVCAYYWKRQP